MKKLRHVLIVHFIFLKEKEPVEIEYVSCPQELKKTTKKNVYNAFYENPRCTNTKKLSHSVDRLLLYFENKLAYICKTCYIVK